MLYLAAVIGSRRLVARMLTFGADPNVRFLVSACMHAYDMCAETCMD